MRLLWLITFLNVCAYSMEEGGASIWWDSLELKAHQKVLSGHVAIIGLPDKDQDLFDYVKRMTAFLLNLKEKGNQYEKNMVLNDVLKSTCSWFPKRMYIAGLVAAGADPNVADSERNPLIQACRAQDFELITFLCEAGATVACADECHAQKKILSDVRKYKIAHYLIERGAALSNGIRTELSLLHDRTVLDDKASWRLVPLYLNKGVAVTSQFENVFHCLAAHAYRYHNNIPKMLKKFNAIVTHLKPEETLRLLKERDKSYHLLPEQTCTIKSPAGVTPYFLAHVMQQKRELLEQIKKVRQTDVPSHKS